MNGCMCGAICDLCKRPDFKAVYSGQTLIMGAAVIASKTLTALPFDTVLKLSREAYNGNEGYDGEPTSIEHHVDQIARLVLYKRARGIPLDKELDY